MGYGLTFEQIRQVNQPALFNKSWGRVASLTEMPEYAMYRIDISAGSAQPLHFFAADYHAFVESGEVIVRALSESGGGNSAKINAGEMLPVPRFWVHSFSSPSGAVIYLFGQRTIEGIQEHLIETAAAAKDAMAEMNVRDLATIGLPTTDVREKYWGRIETIISGDIAAKRIFVQKGGSGSLEFHVEKRETYYIHSGLVRVGLRIGRAENRSIVLEAGQSFDVRPGMMHLRVGLEDSVIIEVSTRDSDSDSYLVEDGQTYRHVDIDSQP